MILANIAARAGKFLSSHQREILTGIGVAGTLATAVLAARGASTAAELIRYEQYKLKKEGDSRPLDNWEKFQIVWRCYVPATVSAGATITAIIFSHKIGTREAAALGAAFTVSQEAFDRYRAKVVETMGETKETKIRDKIAQDLINERPPVSSQIIITGRGKVLCYDVNSDRYFESAMQELQAAQNEVNMVLNTSPEGYATLTDFYGQIGLRPTLTSDVVGWVRDRGQMLYLKFSGTLVPEDHDHAGEPCMVVDYEAYPIRDSHHDL